MSNEGNGMMIECSVCHSKVVVPVTRAVSRAYDQHRSTVSAKQRALNVLLVVGDCMLVGLQAARNNVLLAVPAFLYAINNYLKFTMQLYFNPATVKMLSNLKVLVIAVLLKIIMKRRFSIIQWEALAL